MENTSNSKVRSFGLVDHKIAEANFFLDKLAGCGADFLAARCYTSAFASATRSVTFTIQSVLGNHAQFESWYAKHQDSLRQDATARFFRDFRNASEHIGDNPVGSGGFSPGRKALYYFMPTPDIPDVPEQDVEACCRAYLARLVTIVYDCYMEFGSHINSHQYYTADYFLKIGKTIDDADEEVFGVRGWTAAAGFPEGYRWQAIRDSVTGCEIDHLFEQYLGKTTPEPERLPELPAPTGEGWFNIQGKGRVYIPQIFRKTGDPSRDLELYIESLPRRS